MEKASEWAKGDRLWAGADTLSVLECKEGWFELLNPRLNIEDPVSGNTVTLERVIN